MAQVDDALFQPIIQFLVFGTLLARMWCESRHQVQGLQLTEGANAGVPCCWVS